MLNNVSINAYLFNNAVEAFKYGVLEEYINSLTKAEIKELKYYVLSTSFKINKLILHEINKQELDNNYKYSYKRINK